MTALQCPRCEGVGVEPKIGGLCSVCHGSTKKPAGKGRFESRAETIHCICGSLVEYCVAGTVWCTRRLPMTALLAASLLLAVPAQAETVRQWCEHHWTRCHDLAADSSICPAAALRIPPYCIWPTVAEMRRLLSQLGREQ